MLRLGIVGITGRMGQALLQAAAEAPDVVVSAGLLRPGRPSPPPALTGTVFLTDRPVDFMRAVDVAVDFSHPDLTTAAVAAAAEIGVPFVTGTTGLTTEHEDVLRTAAQCIPLVRAANFSLGIAVLQRILPAIAAALRDWDCEVIERHHRGKRDAPSGTALALAQLLCGARAAPDAPLVYGRGPGEARRRPGEIGLHAVRAGGEAGRHTVLFASEDEGLEVTHWTQHRLAYARGALQAARRIRNRPPGLYTFADLLFE